MEEIFKQNLLSIRSQTKPQTFGEALFPLTYWKPHQGKVKLTLRKVVSEEFTEKRQVLESFERFAHEQVQETATPIIKVDGGEVVVKKEPSWEGVSKYSKLNDLRNDLSLSADFLNIIFNNKNSDKVSVIFVTESFRAWDEVSKELKDGFINELIAGFPVKTAELFERMITAMKLTPEEVILFPVESEGYDLALEVMKVASFFKPEVIITLGAKASQKILKSSDRLSLIHGQFFQRKIEGQGSFQVVPLFHPSIIETNQNMKKTAWADMQKIMKYLKKLT